MKKTKILFVIPSFNSGGTVSSLASIINSPLSSSYDIDVFSIKKSGYNKTLSSFSIGLNDAISALHCGFSSLSTKDRIKFTLLKTIYRISALRTSINNYVERRTIRRIEERKKYDYVVAFQEHYTTRFVQGFHCERKIAWVHCDYAYAVDESNNELEMYSRYFKIVCVSNYTRQSFISRYPLLENNTIAIHNLFDESIVLEKANELIDDKRFDSSVFTIISVGRVSAVKQFSLIPSIASGLKNHNIKFKWYILGAAKYPEELQKLNDGIERNDVQECVFYLGAKINPYPYYLKSDLLVCLSKSEACPMIFNEAKILHLPILSTDFGSACEFIEDGKNGFITTLEQIPVKIEELIRHTDNLDLIKSNNSFIDDDPNRVIVSQLNNLFQQ